MNIVGKIRGFLEQGRRVLTISKKPDWKEFSLMVKVTAIGIIIISIIGYLIILFFTITNLGA